MKKRLTLPERQELIRAFRESGMSQMKFCEERGVSIGTLQNYLKKSFIDIPVPVSPRTTEVEVTFPDGTVVRIRS
jgi:hypothetical protein